RGPRRLPRRGDTAPPVAKTDRPSTGTRPVGGTFRGTDPSSSRVVDDFHTRRGREVAAIVPIEMVREYREWEEERVLRIINERRASAQPGIPMNQIMNEVLESDE